MLLLQEHTSIVTPSPPVHPEIAALKSDVSPLDKKMIFKHFNCPSASSQSYKAYLSLASKQEPLELMTCNGSPST